MPYQAMVDENGEQLVSKPGGGYETLSQSQARSAAASSLIDPSTGFPRGVPKGAWAEMVGDGTDSKGHAGKEVLGGYAYQDPATGMYTRYGVDGTKQNTFSPGTGGDGWLNHATMAFAESPVTDALLKGALIAGTGYVGAGAAGLLGSGAAGATAGTTAASSSYALAPAGTGFGGAAAGSGLQAGGTIGMGASTVGSGLSSSLAANSLAPSLGVTGLLADGAGAYGAAGAAGAGTVAGTTAGTTAAGAAGASKVISTGNATLDSILNGAKDYAPLIGAVGGALASKDSTTSTTADKSPWAPAQKWMTDNLGLGQAMQARYAANPFNQQQQEAYNNSAQGGNQFRTTANGLIGQMNQRQAFNRAAPNQVSPYNFGSSNLGMTTMPFPGVKYGSS